MDLQIQPFDPASATAEAWRALHPLDNQEDAEYFPEDPPVTPATTQRRWGNIAAYLDRRMWLVFTGPERTPVARGLVETWKREENQHLAEFDIYVSPPYRRRGIARHLLVPIVAAAREWQRRLLLSFENDWVPSGGAFLARLGAQQALVGSVSQLTTVDLDRALTAAWIAGASERAGGLAIHGWDGPYPDDQLTAIAEMHDLMNTAPRGDLDVEDRHRTPEQLRAQESQFWASGDERWTLYIRDPRTGTLAGYTEVRWNPGQPTVVWQEDTAVVPAYRNRGLGRWLKAAMLERIVRERPQVRFVRTGNADTNAPMLKINNELGFQPHGRWTQWQVSTDTVAQYLAGSEQLTAGSPPPLTSE